MWLEGSRQECLLYFLWQAVESRPHSEWVRLPSQRLIVGGNPIGKAKLLLLTCGPLIVGHVSYVPELCVAQLE